MEGWMDEAEARLAPLRAFILPGGSPGAAELHVCRTVCRRAERAAVPLLREGDQDAGTVVRYLNRLSDLLFVLARLESAEAGGAEVEWKKEGG
jgi:cob(I)alamin adenosyltransferase